MKVSCEWTTDERLLLAGTIATHAVEMMQTGQMSGDGMLRALETIAQLQAMPAAFLETQREQILRMCEPESRAPSPL